MMPQILQKKNLNHGERIPLHYFTPIYTWKKRAPQSTTQKKHLKEGKGGDRTRMRIKLNNEVVSGLQLTYAGGILMYIDLDVY